jgi:hypothetical protein
MASAGVFMLAGPGWALLAGAVLALVLWRREPDWVSFGRRITAVTRVTVSRVRAAPRRVTAVAGMGAAAVVLPVGVGVAAGTGLALVAAAVVLAGVALITGWGA